MTRCQKKDNEGSENQVEVGIYNILCLYVDVEKHCKLCIRLENVTNTFYNKSKQADV